MGYFFKGFQTGDIAAEGPAGGCESLLHRIAIRIELTNLTPSQFPDARLDFGTVSYYDPGQLVNMHYLFCGFEQILD